MFITCSLKCIQFLLTFWEIMESQYPILNNQEEIYTFVIKPFQIWCPEKFPRKKRPPEKCAPENYPPKISPQRKLVPGKLPPGKMPLRKIAPLGKLFHQIFVAFNIIFLIFKLFIVTSFRGVSKTPAVSIIDLLVTVVNVVTNVTKSSCLDVVGSQIYL